jgi:hypothetical protein
MVQVITSARLAELRNVVASLTTATNWMQQAGLDTAPLLAEVDAIVKVSYAVLIPCLLCDGRFPAEVAVDGSSWPQLCICGECSARLGWRSPGDDRRTASPQG